MASLGPIDNSRILASQGAERELNQQSEGGLEGRQVSSRLSMEVASLAANVEGVCQFHVDSTTTESQINGLVDVINDLSNSIANKIAELTAVRDIQGARGGNSESSIENHLEVLSGQMNDLSNRKNELNETLNSRLAKQEIAKSRGSRISDSSLKSFISHLEGATPKDQKFLLQYLILSQRAHGSITERLTSGQIKKYGGEINTILEKAKKNDESIKKRRNSSDAGLKKIAAARPRKRIKHSRLESLLGYLTKDFQNFFSRFRPGTEKMEPEAFAKEHLGLNDSLGVFMRDFTRGEHASLTYPISRRNREGNTDQILERNIDPKMLSELSPTVKHVLATLSLVNPTALEGEGGSKLVKEIHEITINRPKGNAMNDAWENALLPAIFPKILGVRGGEKALAVLSLMTQRELAPIQENLTESLLKNEIILTGAFRGETEGKKNSLNLKAKPPTITSTIPGFVMVNGEKFRFDYTVKISLSNDYSEIAKTDLTVSVKTPRSRKGWATKRRIKQALAPIKVS